MQCAGLAAVRTSAGLLVCDLFTEGRGSSGIAAGTRVSHWGRCASFLLWGDQVVGSSGGVPPAREMSGRAAAGVSFPPGSGAPPAGPVGRAAARRNVHDLSHVY